MKLNINQSRKLWWAISAVAIVAGLVAMLISWQQIGAPLRPSLDFIGGTRLQLERDCRQPNNCAQPINITAVREVLAAQGLANSSIQILGQEQQGISIRTSTLDVEQRTQLQDALSQRIGTFDPQSTQIDTVGPTIGRQLLTSGLLALIVSFVGIIIYISLRFQLDFAVFAIVALLHDVLTAVGVFSVLGLVWGVEVDSLFIVALLTITGFSVNDTVVIYDRIREILKINPNRPISEIVDDAVNQTLTRSINTTLTTLLALVAIFLFGGETLKLFALALIIGFICGAYSSIFIASTLLTWWRERNGQRFATQGIEVIDSPSEET
ncbi:protein translocase subunit SecF [Gloeocapsopsis dulcis]|uniref:Protein-export membrane protein SecF n=1 Tax=Gloeocapsopsis dulcis AAB1 = 1H9 TaxID=1433147 RepID=A0A6N8FVR1_9CHRO|nr:protein translocase subunit SecF [Gloeocapsopsis dulcis]MUL37163.1 protein translocase subunit SecF [Gloeocapsopsis dulcis AAB1 = 1H9]WNN90231.1 protein translocase subunit SecF [Gloeocapsopsis dulcis]